MRSSGCKYNFKGVDKFFRNAKREVMRIEASVGERAVRYAKENGNYQDHTGHLRESNKFSVSEKGLRIYNDADYSAYVEAKGYEVISAAALFAETELREIFG